MMFSFQSFKKSIIPQLFIYYTFIVHGLIINILEILTYIFVWPFNRKLYRRLNHYLAYSLWGAVTAWSQYYSPTKIELYIKEEDFKMLGKENVICVLNHKYNIDWLMGWLICQQVGLLGGCKVVVKDVLKHIPILGWSFSFSEQIFVKRVWETDNKTLVRDLKAVFDYPKDLPFCVCIFCEGTRFCPEKHAISMDVAQKKGLSPLKYHLLPRTRGFKLVASQIKGKIDYLYDVTLAIDKVNGEEPSITHINDGIGLNVKAYFRRIPVSSIPIDDDKACDEFLHELYRHKDEAFDCYVKNGDFLKMGVKKIVVEKNKYDLINSLIMMVIILVPSIYYFTYLFIISSLLSKSIFLLTLVFVNLLMKYIMNYSSAESKSNFGLKKTD